MAQLGLEAVRRNSPVAKAVGLRNVAVFGRSVTWVLQNLRKTMPKQFDHWYAPHADEMRSDPLIRFFVVLRNQIEKQGLTPPSSSTEFEAKKDLTLPDDLGPPPPGAESFFLDAGGAGWNVSIGSETQRFYVELPEVGEKVVKDDPFGAVESVKAVSDVYAPVGGTVLEINDVLPDNPETINDDPYGDGWMIRVELADKDDLKDLMDAEEYAEYVEQQKADEDEEEEDETDEEEEDENEKE